MINSITLKNFRQHRDLHVEFGAGFTVLRGENEAGKSNAIWGIAYALGGVRALPDTLEETVTWNEPVNSLKVTLVITIDDVQYTIKRSKSGCECNYDGGTVTGQTEVSTFMARIMKVDAGAAARLMISPQSEIRGALESGAKATTELIERLSDFDQIDKLIERMQEKLVLGNTATATANIATAQERLDAASAVTAPDFAALEHSIAAHASVIALAKTNLAVAQEEYNTAVARHAQVQAQESERSALARRAAAAQTQLTTAKSALAALEAAPVAEVERPDERIQSLMGEKANLKNVAAARKAYAEVQPLFGPQTFQIYEGTEAQWAAGLQELKGELAEVQSSLRDADVRYAKAQLKFHLGTCSFCGQDFSAVPEVIARNAGVQQELDTLSAEIQTLQQRLDTLQGDIKDMEEVRRLGQPWAMAAQKYSAYLNIDESQYPPLLSWKGEVPVTPEADPDYDAMIASIRAAVSARTSFEAQVTKNTEAAKIATRELEATGKRSSEIGASGNLAEATAAVTEARSNVSDCQETLDEAQNFARTLDSNLVQARRAWETAQRERESCEATLATWKTALAELEFNNALLKRVRACRPMISDRLWGIVLSAVSKYFSDMRGERSRVTKDSDGFQVDGHSMSGLSGSAKDILGLAIRVALVRTFLPSSPFLILDEPAAACSDTRTDNMLGFITACGFKQVILITHEDVSETIADHVITLGE